MYQRHLDVDPITGAVETFYYDDATGRCMIDRQVDVEPILEWNKAQFNQFDERARWGHEPMHHVARVPLEVMEQFKLAHPGINPYTKLEGDDKRVFDRWLDDSANKAWRTRPGKLSS